MRWSFLGTSFNLYGRKNVDEHPTLKAALDEYCKMYGVCSCITALWNAIAEDPCKDNLLGSNSPLPKRLLWRLCFLHHYPTESIAATLFHVMEKILHKWVWICTMLEVV